MALSTSRFRHVDHSLPLDSHFGLLEPLAGSRATGREGTAKVSRSRVWTIQRNLAVNPVLRNTLVPPTLSFPGACSFKLVSRLWYPFSFYYPKPDYPLQRECAATAASCLSTAVLFAAPLSCPRVLRSLLLLSDSPGEAPCGMPSLRRAHVSQQLRIDAVRAQYSTGSLGPLSSPMQIPSRVHHQLAQ